MLGLNSRRIVVALLALAGCGGDDGGGSTSIECGTGTSGPVALGAPALTVTGSAAKALAGASIAAPDLKSNAPGTVTIGCRSAGIIPSSYIALSPAVSFGPDQVSSGQRMWEVTIPFRPALMPKGAHYNSVQVFVERGAGVQSFAAAVPNLRFDDETGLAHFRIAELATYQIAVRADANVPRARKYVNRAIVGISMGGGGAAHIGLANPDKFDVIAGMVPEPGMDLNYSLRMFRDMRFGGFCTKADEIATAGAKKIGMECPLSRDVLVDQNELPSTFEKLLYQKGEGVGLTLDRSLYLKGVRDFSRAYSNVALWNSTDPYLPPGVPESWTQKTVDSRCGSNPDAPIILKNFYDARFNPDGDKDVITFCDGNDSSAGLGLGVFDPAATRDEPAENFLAVDVNGNGKRDQGEPAIFQQGEDWADVGSDGKANAQEDGYNATSNPDPARDDFHYLKNPLGTEGDFRYEQGEPYMDCGVDGVCGKGCAQGSAAGCYDYGEGDGKRTDTPNLERWRSRSPLDLWNKLTPAQQARLDIYVDAGIRDFLNSHVSANSFFGQLVAQNNPGRIYDEFKATYNNQTARSADITNFDFTRLGRHMYVRYGNPDASETEQERGDGRHVGTGPQVVDRMITTFAYVASRYPQGDREAFGTSADNFKRGLSFTSTATGRTTPYSLFVPPGYDAPENASKRYPVVYFFHGYGMSPEDLVDLSAIFSNFMVSPQIPKEKRFPKFLIVYVDGRCRPGGNLPLTGGDMCERGTFYTDAAGNTTAKMESDLFQLMNFIDANYRTKGEETLQVVD